MADQSSERLFTGPDLAPASTPSRRGTTDLTRRACRPLATRSLHRRLLGLFDIAGAALALMLVLGASRHALGHRRWPARSSLSCSSSSQGLFDRDELRIVHSTLDELPLLLQLTALFALS